MKKLLSAFLTLCLLLSLSATLTACEHKCEFATEWSKDANSHWHACTDKKCTEIADKADHIWNEGEVTTQATQEADGVKTVTCTVCAYTKTESIAFTGLSREEWNAALGDSVFENFVFSSVSTMTYYPGEQAVEAETLYKFTKDCAWAKLPPIWAGFQGNYATDAETVEALRQRYVDLIKDLTPYESFTYDAETKTYKATEEIPATDLMGYASNVTLTFAGNRLVEIKYFTQAPLSALAIITATITLSDYGTVVLTPPAQ